MGENYKNFVREMDLERSGDAGNVGYWRGFPKGMRVLLVEPNATDNANITYLLDQCGYDVTALASHEEALQLVKEQKSQSFDIGLVDVGLGRDAKNEFSSTKIVESYKKIFPVIATTWTDKTDVMFQAISAGAVDVLSKPISLQKLRNIYQHLVRKDVSLPSKLGQQGSIPTQGDIATESMTLAEVARQGLMVSPQGLSSSYNVEQFPTEQSIMSANLRQPQDTRMQPQAGPSKSQFSNNQYLNFEGVTVNKSASNGIARQSYPFPGHLPEGTVVQNVIRKDGAVKVENNTAGMRNTSNLPSLQSGPPRPNCGMNVSAVKSEYMKCMHMGYVDKRKKVDWTPDLHRRFVKAVEQLGIDNAIPSRILELMQVKCLTRHHIASHLQKYRKHRKNLLSRGQELNQTVATQWPPGRLIRSIADSSKPSTSLSGAKGSNTNTHAAKGSNTNTHIVKGSNTNTHIAKPETHRLNQELRYKLSNEKSKKAGQAKEVSGNRAKIGDGKRIDRRVVNSNQHMNSAYEALQGMQVPLATVSSIQSGIHVMGQPVPNEGLDFPRHMSGSPSDIFSQQQIPWKQNAQNPGMFQNRNSFAGDEGGFFDPVSSMRYDYDLGNDSLELAIKDVLNQDLDSFQLPIGLKPPVMDSLIEEAEQRGFRLDILNSSDEERDTQKERDLIINNIDKNIERSLY